mmetsp:Transcript_18072/g.23785  ORF Transcript_18072/g.23785 Transcript_18072/m.23785 type:complete len:85 (-) Transcript_18072:667-921(-)
MAFPLNFHQFMLLTENYRIPLLSYLKTFNALFHHLQPKISAEIALFKNNLQPHNLQGWREGATLSFSGEYNFHPYFAVTLPFSS